MNTIKFLIPSFIISSIISGIIGKSSVATIFLAIGLGLIFSLLAIDTIYNYILPDKDITRVSSKSIPTSTCVNTYVS